MNLSISPLGSVLVLLFALSPLSCKVREKAELKPSAGPAAPIVQDAGCPHQKGGSCGPSPQNSAQPGPRAQKQLYGSPLASSNRVELARLLAEPERFHDKTVRVSGWVRRACSKKGCWMEVSPSAKNDEAPGCRVTFKDYGFLVPTDAAGSHAQLDAVVQVTHVQPQAVAHYEAEGASFPNKATDGSALEVRLIATGVELSGSDGG